MFGIGWRFIIGLPYAFMIFLLIERFRGFKDATEMLLILAIVQVTAIVIAHFLIWNISRKARSGYSRIGL